MSPEPNGNDERMGAAHVWRRAALIFVAGLSGYVALSLVAWLAPQALDLSRHSAPAALTLDPRYGPVLLGMVVTLVVALISQTRGDPEFSDHSVLRSQLDASQVLAMTFCALSTGASLHYLVGPQSDPRSWFLLVAGYFVVAYFLAVIVEHASVPVERALMSRNVETLTQLRAEQSARRERLVRCQESGVARLCAWVGLCACAPVLIEVIASASGRLHEAPATVAQGALTSVGITAMTVGYGLYCCWAFLVARAYRATAMKRLSLVVPLGFIAMMLAGVTRYSVVAHISVLGDAFLGCYLMSLIVPPMILCRRWIVSDLHQHRQLSGVLLSRLVCAYIGSAVSRRERRIVEAMRPASETLEQHNCRSDEAEAGSLSKPDQTTAPRAA